MERPAPSPMRALVVLAALALAACEPEPAASPGAPPTPFVGDLEAIDDGAADPGFAAFRDTLRAVVARRDTAAVLALVGPGARLSFGDEAGGPDGLRAMWLDGDPPGGRTLWSVLAHVLEGGSVEEDGAFTAPAAAGYWPEDLDPFETVAVVGEAVPASAEPGGAPIATVSRLALPRVGPAEDGWQAVVLPDGREAVVPADAAYSPVGYRLTAWDDGDGWRLQTLVAGD